MDFCRVNGLISGLVMDLSKFFHFDGKHVICKAGLGYHNFKMFDAEH